MSFSHGKYNLPSFYMRFSIACDMIERDMTSLPVTIHLQNIYRQFRQVRLIISVFYVFQQGNFIRVASTWKSASLKFYLFFMVACFSYLHVPSNVQMGDKRMRCTQSSRSRRANWCFYVTNYKKKFACSLMQVTL